MALFRDAELVFCESFTADRSHSSELFAVIERALAGGGAARSGLLWGWDPGSYAGVRIAIAAGIGLSVATGAELVGVALGCGVWRRGSIWRWAMRGVADIRLRMYGMGKW